MRAGRDRDREDRWEGGRDLPSSKPYTWGETYGLSPNFLEGLGIAPPLVCRVFIANVSVHIYLVILITILTTAYCFTILNVLLE